LIAIPVVPVVQQKETNKVKPSKQTLEVRMVHSSKQNLRTHEAGDAAAACTYGAICGICKNLNYISCTIPSTSLPPHAHNVAYCGAVLAQIRYKQHHTEDNNK
jgi:hypothetical protein